MVFDFDDYCQDNNRLDLLWKLKEANPDFRCTVFAIPGLGDENFWASTPDWIELAVHGWKHPHPREAQEWSYAETAGVLQHKLVERFAHGFKAPGWQISDATYQALLDYGWWVADQAYNDARRPPGLRVYKLGLGSWHGHIPNVCGNGLEETFEIVCDLVDKADCFQFVSEVVK